MFRRFQNPIRQGTEALPNVMQAPVVVRVTGAAAGSPEAATVIQAYLPTLQGFLRSQRQNQESGGLNHVHVRRDLGDIVVTYDRLYGREQITVTPA